MEINENNLSQLAVYLQQTLSPAADVRQEFNLFILNSKDVRYCALLKTDNREFGICRRER
jgi:hypothetical protein